MKRKYLILSALTKLGLQINAIVQISAAVSYSVALGGSASSYLIAHGITQPVFGAISFAASLPLELKIITHYVKSPAKPQETPKEITKLSAWSKNMEKKYGTQWMDRVSAVAETIAKIDKKK